MMNNQPMQDDRAPKSNPLGGLKISVFCVSLAVMLLITAWPHTFGRTSLTMNHNAAMICMFGMCCGFVYGIGFIPKQAWLKVLFSAPIALGLMSAGFLMMLF